MPVYTDSSLIYLLFKNSGQCKELAKGKPLGLFMKQLSVLKVWQIQQLILKGKCEKFTPGYEKQNTTRLCASSAEKKKVSYIIFEGKGCTAEDQKVIMRKSIMVALRPFPNH